MCKVIEYKLIEGYDDYMVSSDGKVWSLKHGGMKELKSAPRNKYGHLSVCLCRDGKMEAHYVHQLVLSTFVPKPSEDLEVLHLNSVPTDNRLENLEWGTRKDNLNDPHFRALQTNRPDHSTPIICLEKGVVYPSAHEASRQTGIANSHISACCRGERKTAGGYHWAKFIEGDNPIYK